MSEWDGWLKPAQPVPPAPAKPRSGAEWTPSDGRTWHEVPTSMRTMPAELAANPVIMVLTRLQRTKKVWPRLRSDAKHWNWETPAEGNHRIVAWALA